MSELVNEFQLEVNIFLREANSSLVLLWLFVGGGLYNEELSASLFITEIGKPPLTIIFLWRSLCTTVVFYRHEHPLKDASAVRTLIKWKTGVRLRVRRIHTVARLANAAEVKFVSI